MNSTVDFALVFDKDIEPVLSMMVDSDYAADLSDCRSFSGVLASLGSAMFCAQCSKQPVTALSTAESEFYALCKAVKVEAFFRSALEFITGVLAPTIVDCDSQGAIRFALNPVSNSRVKHIRISFAYVRDALLEGILKLRYIVSANNTADLLTKPLGAVKQTHFCKFFFNDSSLSC